MSRINSLLEHLLSAVYGRDVRQSIHDSIKECYDDVTTGKTMAEKAAGAANTAASTANSAATNANTARTMRMRLLKTPIILALR